MRPIRRCPFLAKSSDTSKPSLFVDPLPSEVLDLKTAIELKSKVLRELPERQGLDPHDAEAFCMALRFHTQLMNGRTAFLMVFMYNKQMAGRSRQTVIPYESTFEDCSNSLATL